MGRFGLRRELQEKQLRVRATRRLKSQPDPSADSMRYGEWYRENDGLYFHSLFYLKVAKLQKELADLHIDDPELDRLIAEHERYFAERQQFSQEAIDHPMAFHLRIEEIREIGDRFKHLTTQIPH